LPYTAPGPAVAPRPDSPGMHLESADALINALRGSGLFTPEQLEVLLRELAPLGDDAVQIVKHLLRTKRLTQYQLKKVINGKATELIVGPYIVTDRLGSGGMSRVYRARERATGRPCALKVLRPALVANPIVRGRSAREVQAAGTLDHPNIVRVFDAGVADGKVYMAMEFVDGIDLARLIHIYESVEIPEACEYIRQVALGLQHAHERGFVHRDIKPSNVVVAGERHLPQATEPAVVKILDLGLARAIDPADMVAPDLTRDHTVVGTPDYMAPEQAKNSKHVDTRADLYSLGCTFYFLLTARVPFPVAGAIEKIMAHQDETPPPVQSIRPEVPDAVAELITRLMAKRPEDRVQTAAEVAAALAPHARYPAGAPPVPVVPANAYAAGGSTSDVGDEDAEPTSGSFSSPGDASVGPISPLEISEEESPEHRVPTPPAVAPSDRTPRPHTVAPSVAEPPVPPTPPAPAAPQAPPPPPELAAPKSGRHKRKRDRTKRAREVPQFVWVALALLGVAILALMLWLVSRP
jgi:eukaryotic-like serine/threonine-protein kinase